jgi:hypothetical protein
MNIQKVLERYGEIKAYAKKSGLAISDNDGWIAAAMSVAEAVLLTSTLFMGNSSPVNLSIRNVSDSRRTMTGSPTSCAPAEHDISIPGRARVAKGECNSSYVGCTALTPKPGKSGHWASNRIGRLDGYIHFVY